MGIFRQLKISYWQDPFIFELSYLEKYFYLYLISSSKSTQCGIYEITKSMIALETGLDKDTIDELINKFSNYGKIIYSKETNEMFIKNWIKHNLNSSPKVIKCVEKELKNIKSDYLKNLFYEECKKYDYKINVDIKNINSKVAIDVNENINTDNKDKKLEIIKGGVGNGNDNDKYSKSKYATAYESENSKFNTKPSEEQLRYARELTEDIRRIQMQ